MSFTASNWAWKQELKASKKLTLLALADCLNDNTKRLNPSISFLSEKTGLDRKTVIANLFDLEELGLISRRKTFGASSCYSLNLSVFCLSQTSTKKGTSTKNGTIPVPKTVPDQYQKRDTNLEEPRKNLEVLGGKPPKPPQKQKPKKPKFQKPTIDQVVDYKNELNAQGKNYLSDPVAFFDYHESSGWVVGKSLKPMKDWKGAFRNWERNERKWEKVNADKQSSSSNYASSLYDYAKATDF